MLGQVNWTTSNTSDLIKMQVNAFEPFVLPTRENGIEKTSENALPAKTSVLMNRCTTGDDNYIVWTFR